MKTICIFLLCCVTAITVIQTSSCYALLNNNLGDNDKGASNLLSTSVVAGTIFCNGGETKLTVSASGGLAPYIGTGSYRVTAGTYSFTVTDAEGSTAVANITLTEPEVLAASFAAEAILCNEGYTVIKISGSGGTEPHIGVGEFEVMAGIHNFMVADSNGCNVTMTLIVAESNALNGSSNAGAVLNDGGISTFTVAEPGKTSQIADLTTLSKSSYGYIWSNGAIIKEIPMDAYTLTVPDKYGCIMKHSGQVNLKYCSLCNREEDDKNSVKEANTGLLKIYPNPVFDLLKTKGFFEESKVVKIILTDMIGMSYSRIYPLSQLNGIIELNTAEIPRGLYVNQLIIDDKLMTRDKIVIVK